MGKVFGAVGKGLLGGLQISQPVVGDFVAFPRSQDYIPLLLKEGAAQDAESDHYYGQMDDIAAVAGAVGGQQAGQGQGVVFAGGAMP